MPGATIPDIGELEDFSTLEESMDRWREGVLREGREQGREEGRAEGTKEGMEKGLLKGRQEGQRAGEVEGMRRVLLRQLAGRFGVLPKAVRQQVARISSAAKLARLALGVGAALLALVSRPAFADEARWTPIGPDGGSVTALAVARSARRTVYAGTDSGMVFRSSDAGASWARTTTDPVATAIRGLAVDPRDPRKVWAAVYAFSSGQSGLLVSGDGGATWTPGDGLQDVGVEEVAVDPADPSTGFAASNQGLAVSRDGGASWRPVAGFPSGVGLAAVRFGPDGTLWAASTFSGVFASADHGATWTRKYDAGGAFLTAFAVHPTLAGSAVAVFAAPRLVATSDGGATWTPRGAPPDVTWSLAFSPDGSTLYAATNSGLARSSDGGRTWSEVAGFPARRAQSLAVPPAPPGVLYAGVWDFGVFKSTDRAASFRAAGAGLADTWIVDLAIAPSRPSVLYTSVQGIGVVRSVDSGASWAAVFTREPSTTHDLAVDPRDSRRVYAALSYGRVAHSVDNGSSWQVRALPDGSCLEPTALVIHPRQPADVYLAGGLATACERGHDTSCLAFQSGDDGAAWKCAGKPDTSFFDLVVDPSRPAILYAAASQGVLKSFDGGGSWGASGQGLPVDFVRTLAISPLAPRTLWAGTPEGPYKTVDGGRTWRALRAGLPLEASVIALALAPSDPAVLYAVLAEYVPEAQGYRFRVYASADGGETWRLLAVPDLPSDGIPVLRVDPRRPGVLYAGTRHGLWRLDPPAAVR
jgi:photosystem II stability/assembly factor-like uncharacterized protein